MQKLSRETSTQTLLWSKLMQSSINGKQSQSGNLQLALLQHLTIHGMSAVWGERVAGSWWLALPQRVLWWRSHSTVPLHSHSLTSRPRVPSLQTWSPNSIPCKYTHLSRSSLILHWGTGTANYWDIFHKATGITQLQTPMHCTWQSITWLQF